MPLATKSVGPFVKHSKVQPLPASLTHEPNVDAETPQRAASASAKATQGRPS